MNINYNHTRNYRVNYRKLAILTDILKSLAKSIENLYKLYDG